jgi:hypothetical protein
MDSYGLFEAMWSELLADSGMRPAGARCGDVFALDFSGRVLDGDALFGGAVGGVGWRSEALRDECVAASRKLDDFTTADSEESSDSRGIDRIWEPADGSVCEGDHASLRMF